MKHHLTSKQVEVLRPIYERMKQAEQNWQVALILLGLEDSEIVGGDLDTGEPYLEVAEADG